MNFTDLESRKCLCVCVVWSFWNLSYPQYVHQAGPTKEFAVWNEACPGWFVVRSNRMYFWLSFLCFVKAAVSTCLHWQHMNTLSSVAECKPEAQAGRKWVCWPWNWTQMTCLLLGHTKRLLSSFLEKPLVRLPYWGEIDPHSSHTHTHTHNLECGNVIVLARGSCSKILLGVRVSAWAAITTHLYTISVRTRNKWDRLDNCLSRHAWYLARDEESLDQTALCMLVEAAPPVALLAVAMTGAVSRDSSWRSAAFILKKSRTREELLC